MRHGVAVEPTITDQLDVINSRRSASDDRTPAPVFDWKPVPVEHST